MSGKKTLVAVALIQKIESERKMWLIKILHSLVIPTPSPRISWPEVCLLPSPRLPWPQLSASNCCSRFRLPTNKSSLEPNIRVSVNFALERARAPRMAAIFNFQSAKSTEKDFAIARTPLLAVIWCWLVAFLHISSIFIANS